MENFFNLSFFEPNKYVLVLGKERNNYFVVSDYLCGNHNAIITKYNIKNVIKGGGLIEFDEPNKKIIFCGESVKFHKADHSIAYTVAREALEKYIKNNLPKAAGFSVHYETSDHKILP